jgi:hypothetical protein
MLSIRGELHNEIPSTFVEEMRERGHTIPIVGKWWLNLARRLVADDPRGLSILGEALALRVDKKQPFDKGTLSRFVKGKHPVTYQLINAIGLEWPRLPPPIVFPTTYLEAVEIDSIHARHAKRVHGEDTEDSILHEIRDTTPLKAPPGSDGRRRGKRVVSDVPAARRKTG